MPSARRQGPDVAHLVPAQHAGGLADHHPAHGGAQRAEHRSGDGAAGRQVPLEQPGAGAGRSEAGGVGSGEAAGLISSTPPTPTRKHLQQVPFARPRHLAAPHEDGVGSADRDASRLVSARRQPGVPPHGPAAHAADRRRPAAGHSPSGREGDRSPGQDLPAEDARMDGMVRHHAAGAPRRHVGAERMGAGQGRDLRPRHDHDRSRHARRIHDLCDLPRRPDRRDHHSHRPRDRLHRDSSGAADPSTQAADSSMREVMIVDRNWRNMEGRWFAGGYDELGIDVKLDRVGTETRVLGTDRTALKQGGAGQELKIYGANFASSLRPADIDLGPGITVARIVNVTPDVATVAVDVAANASIGVRDLFVGRVGASACARGVRQHRQHQGEAGLGDGARRRRDVPEDAGAVRSVGVQQRRRRQARHRRTTSSSAWSTRRGAWRNTLPPTTTTTSSSSAPLDAKTGRFTPNVDGPNPARIGSRNNIGDVWVVARYAAEAAGGKPLSTLRARAHLLVTVPLYMRFDPSEARPSRRGVRGPANEHRRTSRVPRVRSRRAPVPLSGAERGGVRARRLLGGDPRFARRGATRRRRADPRAGGAIRPG